MMTAYHHHSIFGYFLYFSMLELLSVDVPDVSAANMFQLIKSYRFCLLCIQAGWDFNVGVLSFNQAYCLGRSPSALAYFCLDRSTIFYHTLPLLKRMKSLYPKILYLVRTYGLMKVIFSPSACFLVSVRPFQ